MGGNWDERTGAQTLHAGSVVAALRGRPLDELAAHCTRVLATRPMLPARSDRLAEMFMLMDAGLTGRGRPKGKAA